MSLTAWTIIVVISVVGLVIIIKLAILAFMMTRDERRSIHQQPDGSYDDEEADDPVNRDVKGANNKTQGKPS
jgi:hypothetical protein